MDEADDGRRCGCWRAAAGSRPRPRSEPRMTPVRRQHQQPASRSARHRRSRTAGWPASAPAAASAPAPARRGSRRRDRREDTETVTIAVTSSELTIAWRSSGWRRTGVVAEVQPGMALPPTRAAQAHHRHGDQRQHEEQRASSTSAGATSAKPRASRGSPRSHRASVLQHLGPDVLHLLVEIGVRDGVGLGLARKPGCSSKRSIFFCSSVSAALLLAGMPQ